MHRQVCQPFEISNLNYYTNPFLSSIGLLEGFGKQSPETKGKGRQKQQLNLSPQSQHINRKMLKQPSTSNQV